MNLWCKSIEKTDIFYLPNYFFMHGWGNGMLISVLTFPKKEMGKYENCKHLRNFFGIFFILFQLLHKWYVIFYKFPLLFCKSKHKNQKAVPSAIYINIIREVQNIRFSIDLSPLIYALYGLSIPFYSSVHGCMPSCLTLKSTLTFCSQQCEDRRSRATSSYSLL